MKFLYFMKNYNKHNFVPCQASLQQIVTFFPALLQKLEANNLSEMNMLKNISQAVSSNGTTVITALNDVLSSRAGSRLKVFSSLAQINFLNPPNRHAQQDCMIEFMVECVLSICPYAKDNKSKEFTNGVRRVAEPHLPDVHGDKAWFVPVSSYAHRT